MATFNRAAQMYQKNAVQTASPAKLTLMLYDGAVKFTNIAIEAIEAVDMKYPVAKDFDVVYDYIYRRLVEANMKKDKDILVEALKHIKTMRDTWREVMKLNNVS